MTVVGAGRGAARRHRVGRGASAARPHDRRDARSRAGERASSRGCATSAPRVVECPTIRIEPIDGRADRRLGLRPRLRDVAEHAAAAARPARRRCPLARRLPRRRDRPRHRRGAARVRARGRRGRRALRRRGARRGARRPTCRRARAGGPGRGGARHAARGPARRRRRGRRGAALPHAARVVPRDLERALAADAVAFSAASTVRNFVAAFAGRDARRRARGLDRAGDHEACGRPASRWSPRPGARRRRARAGDHRDARRVHETRCRARSNELQLGGVPAPGVVGREWVPPTQRSMPRSSTRSASPRSARSPVAVSRSWRRAKSWLSLSGGGGGSGVPSSVSRSLGVPCPSAERAR